MSIATIRARSTARRVRFALAVTIVAVGASCGGSDSAAPAPTVPPASPASSDDEPNFVRTTDSADADGAADGGGSAEPPATDTAVAVDTAAVDTPSVDSTASIPTIPESGVPGIDSDDRFCRSWSEFAGTFQALGLASAVGDPDAAIRLEVMASPAMVSAVAGLDEHLPADLEGEELVLIDGFAGPIHRRALRATELLAAAGVTDLDELRTTWLAALAVAGLDDPNLVVDAPAGIDMAGIDAAVAAFASQVPGIVDDPSLTTNAAIPQTEAYLEANCPDQGVLSGNDVISNDAVAPGRGDDVDS